MGGLIATVFFYTSLVGVLSYAFVFQVKGKMDKLSMFISTLIVFLFATFLLFFIIGLSINSNHYTKAIDPVENGYSPFSKNHQLTFFIYFFFSFVGVYKIWKKGKNHPPLLTVLYISFILIGIILSIFTIMQFSFRNDIYIDSTMRYWLTLAPAMYVIISFILLIKIIQEEAIVANQRTFKNKYLKDLNDKLLKSDTLSIWTLLVLVPFYLIITMVLILFGQDFHSLAKVFTETTTWHFSEKTHPPYLDHTGHYLCTVAVCGNPKIVKPLRLGTRHGNEIIVNRQLMIANAFEDIIMKKTPRMHKIIREFYDKYGYPLSKKINSEAKSNLTYLLMKPLEWLFLLTIYASTNQPEKLINEQYSLK